MAKISVISPIVPGGNFEVVSSEHVRVGDSNLAEYVNSTNQNVSKKAEKTDVENALAAVTVEMSKKATKAEVNAALAEKADEETVNAELSKKANSSDVNSALSGKVSNADFNTFKARTDNPHGVTKSQVGLANVDNTSDLDKPVSTATQDALNSKVSKEPGKGLSTNDYTEAEKAKLMYAVDETTKLKGYFTLLQE